MPISSALVWWALGSGLQKLVRQKCDWTDGTGTFDLHFGKFAARGAQTTSVPTVRLTPKNHFLQLLRDEVQLTWTSKSLLVARAAKTMRRGNSPRSLLEDYRFEPI